MEDRIPGQSGTEDWDENWDPGTRYLEDFLISDSVMENRWLLVSGILRSSLCFRILPAPPT